MPENSPGGAQAGARPAAEGAAAGAVRWEDPSTLPVDAVRGLFLTLSKALRSYQLYDKSNPVYLRFVGNLRDAFARAWETQDALHIMVEEDRLLWMGEEVYRDENRSGSLSFLLYRDGIRDLTLRRGVEGEDLELVLDVLHRVRTARSEEDDLVTLLWDLELDHLDYAAVDLLPEGTLLRAPDPEEGAEIDVREILEGELGEEAEPGADVGGVESTVLDELRSIQTEDFNPTLYALDDRERAYLESEYRSELERDVRSDVLNALFDRLEDPAASPARQEEIVAALRQLLPTFLAQAALTHAARLLRELEEVRARLEASLAPEALKGMEGLLEEFSSPESVQELVRAVEEGDVRPRGDDLGLLLRHLRPAALGPLLARAEQVTGEEARRSLAGAIETLARGEEERLLRFLDHDDPAVVVGAVRLMGALRHRPAAPRLARLLDEGEPPVRRAVLEAARTIPVSVLAQSLVRRLEGEDRELRLGAVRVLAEIRYAPAIPTVRRILEGKGIRTADLAEQMAFFGAYADLAGRDAVPFLDRLLNHRNLLGRRQPSELRACAALALGRISDGTAVKAVERARDDDEPAVRSAVARVLSAREDGRHG